MNAQLATIFIALGLATGANLNAQSLVGTWEKQGDGTEMVFTFTENGTGTWEVVVSGDQGFSDSFEFEYLSEYDVTPHHVDILNIDHGFLVGKTMYGVFRLEGDETLVLDFEPGPQESGGERVRPADFTDDAVTLARVR